MAHCVTIMRDTDWFSESLECFTNMWKYVSYFRKNPDMATMMCEYIETEPTKRNNKIMNYVKALCSEPQSEEECGDHDVTVKKIREEICKNKK